MRTPFFLLTPALMFACVGLPIAPAHAQSSWWDKNASPAAQAQEIADKAYSRTKQTPFAGPPPLFTGAALLIGPGRKLIPINIIGRSSEPGGGYLIETRQGRQFVSACDILDPLRFDSSTYSRHCITAEKLY